MTLTPAEVEVLTALMPLAATGPRGVKRFVNLYRLARASRSGEELRRFLGEDGGPRYFAASALMLACETSFKGKQRMALGRRVAALGPGEEASDLASLLVNLAASQGHNDELVAATLVNVWGLTAERWREVPCGSLFRRPSATPSTLPPLTAPPLPPTLRQTSPGAPHERRAD